MTPLNKIVAACFSIFILAATSGLADIANLTVMDNVKLHFSGYADIGFFRTLGNGAAYAPLDSSGLNFYGDPFANPINSQGDPSYINSEEFPISRFDSIQSWGKANFIVNNVNLTILASVSDWLLFEGSLNFEPRPQNPDTLGALVNVDLAYLDFTPFSSLDFHIYAGKFESVFGIEYRRRKAPDRFGVTPSIISRYTIGTPTGVKVRGSFFDNILTLNASVTNDTMYTDRFEHFSYDGAWYRDFKVFSGRLSLGYTFQLGVPIAVEVGGSASYRPPDDVEFPPPTHWQAGADLRVEIGDFAFRAEYMQSHSYYGDNLQRPFLDSQGVYGETSYQALPWLGVFVRGDFRDASHRLRFQERSNLFETNDFRLTCALRFDITYNLIAKVEYTHIKELDSPDILDDVFTSSLVFRF